MMLETERKSQEDIAKILAVLHVNILRNEVDARMTVKNYCNNWWRKKERVER